MSEHTKGPWKIGPRRSVIGLAFDGSEKNICDQVRGGSPDAANANARLIAAAPDLYEAIGSAMQYLDEMIGPCDEGCTCILHDIHAALNKADGGSRVI